MIHIPSYLFTYLYRKNRDTWNNLEYRDRLTLVLAAELIYAVMAQQNIGERGSAGGSSSSFVFSSTQLGGAGQAPSDGKSAYVSGNNA